MSKVLFLFFAVQFFSYAQEYDFPGEIEGDFVFFKSHDNKIHLLKNNIDYVFHKGKWNKIQLIFSQTVKDSLILFHEKGFNNLNIKTIPFENKTLFVLSGGGPVLQLEKDSLFRIDNSVEQRNQFGAAVFNHNNNLFMYGGHGFWTFKNYTTYFDPDSSQWELFRVQSENYPSGRWKPLYNLINNKLYVLGGRTSFPEINMTDVVLEDLFVIDLDTKTIKILSENTNPEIPVFYSNNEGFEFEDKKAYLSKRVITAFDFANNKIYNYGTKQIFDNKLDDTPILNLLDTLVFVKSINGTKKLSFISVDEIKKQAINSIPIVLDPVQSKHFSQFVYALLCLALIIFVYKAFAYKDYIEKLIQHDENWLYYLGKKTRITKEQSLAVNLLEQNGEFTSLELNEIISKNKKYAKSHLTLLRKNFIQALNTAYKDVVGAETILIKSSKLAEDKRQLVYKTNKEISQKESFIRFLFKL
ncbi:hypothetical protein N9E42_02290 [Flavobacteriaceae bacterium]|nr:hypothetical protein [Flavobacteriaceae bacterium]